MQDDQVIGGTGSVDGEPTPQAPGDEPPGDEPLDGSTLAVLERAELAARARRLRAASEAEEVVAAARVRAASIEAAVPDRIASAVTELRAGYEARADAEIAQISREVAVFERHADPDPGSGRRLDAAVALIVAALLGEPAANPSAHGRGR